nr:MAG TPA: hypothetical protein [Caudoviricetes sp.]
MALVDDFRQSVVVSVGCSHVILPFFAVSRRLYNIRSSLSVRPFIMA